MMRYCLLAMLVFTACDPDIRTYGEIMAYAPVYAAPDAVNVIGIAESRTTTNAGKIYAYNNYLFQVEQAEGIHIIDNTVPNEAHKIGFLKVPFCTEIAIRGGYLYTNHLDDLVVFNLNNIEAPQLVKRLEGAFPQVEQKYPPLNNVYFECPDPAKGIVVRWEQKLMKVPACRR
jgi:hypothetical protein